MSDGPTWTALRLEDMDADELEVHVGVLRLASASPFLDEAGVRDSIAKAEIELSARRAEGRS